MGEALGCSCETKEDQEEISLVQPVVNLDGKKQRAGISPDDSELMIQGDGSMVNDHLNVKNEC